jgi:hypothetical protein
MPGSMHLSAAKTRFRPVFKHIGAYRLALLYMQENTSFLSSEQNVPSIRWATEGGSFCLVLMLWNAQPA